MVGEEQDVVGDHAVTPPGGEDLRLAAWSLRGCGQAHRCYRSGSGDNCSSGGGTRCWRACATGRLIACRSLRWGVGLLAGATGSPLTLTFLLILPGVLRVRADPRVSFSFKLHLHVGPVCGSLQVCFTLKCDKSIKSLQVAFNAFPSETHT